MRFTTQRRPLLTTWHHWFAWFPVKVAGEFVWLEKVQRRGGFDHSKNRPHGKTPWRWEYRDVTA